MLNRLKLSPDMELARYAHIQEWKPLPGDVVVFNGFVSHWIGVVSVCTDGVVAVVKHTLPCELLAMGPKDQEKNKIELQVSTIVRSPRGKYAVIQSLPQKGLIWYVN